MKRVAVMVTVATVGLAAGSTASAQAVSARENLRPAMICDCGGGSPWPSVLVRLRRGAPIRR